MGATSENVAERYGVTREQQDRIGYRVRHTVTFLLQTKRRSRHDTTRHTTHDTRHMYQSQQLAAAAQAEGRWDAEIVPVATTVNDKNGQPRTAVLGTPSLPAAHLRSSPFDFLLTVRHVCVRRACGMRVCGAALRSAQTRMKACGPTLHWKAWPSSSPPSARTRTTLQPATPTLG
jgi:hypothetical protein